MACKSNEEKKPAEFLTTTETRVQRPKHVSKHPPTVCYRKAARSSLCALKDFQAKTQRRKIFSACFLLTGGWEEKI